MHESPRVTALLPLIAVAVLAGADVVRAQPASAPTSIRVVETFHHDTGERSRHLVGRLTADEILAIQERLRERAGLQRFERGALDEATRSALRRFQRERGLEVCGCATYETALALGLEPRVVLTRLVGAGDDGRGEPEVEVVYPSGPSGSGAAPAPDTTESEVLERLLERLSAGDLSAPTRFRDADPIFWLSPIHGPFHRPRDLFDRRSGAPDRLFRPSPPGLRPAPPHRVPLPPIRSPVTPGKPRPAAGGECCPP